MANYDLGLNLAINDLQNIGTGAAGSGLTTPNFQPTNTSAGGSSDSILQMEKEILQMLEQLVQMLEQMEGGQGGSGSGSGSGLGTGTGNNPSSGGSGLPPEGAINTQNFKNASFNDWGDPHQSFSGTGGNGTSMSGTANYMGSQSDLIDANDSIMGGYQVSTTVTGASNGNETPGQEGAGVTYNQSATVTMNDGNTTVTMNKGGGVSIDDDGKNVSLAAGQSITLSNGATVSESQDGKQVTVSDNNDSGGSISTTFTSQSYGVDVSGSAQNIDLGGYEVGLGQNNSPETQNGMLA